MMKRVIQQLVCLMAIQQHGKPSQNISETIIFNTPFTGVSSLKIYSTVATTASAGDGAGSSVFGVADADGFTFPGITGFDRIYIAGDNNVHLKGIEIDGLLLVDESVDEKIFITDIDEATPSITTDGGSWSGIDGTGDDAWNQSQEWSAYGEGDTYSNNGWAKAFDGVITNSADVASPQSGTVVWTPATPIPVSGTVTLYLLNENNSKCFINGFDIYVLTGVAADGYNTPVSCSAAQLGGFLQSISLVRQSTGAYLGGVEVDGSLLVDLSIPGAPETFVTGPSFTTTGTVASAGSRTGRRAPVSSAITGVVSSAALIYSDDITGPDNGGAWFKEHAFDGLLNTAASPSTGNYMVWTPTSPVPCITGWRYYQYICSTTELKVKNKRS